MNAYLRVDYPVNLDQTCTRCIAKTARADAFLGTCPECGCSMLAHGPNGCESDAEDDDGYRCSCKRTRA